MSTTLDQDVVLLEPGSGRVAAPRNRGGAFYTVTAVAMSIVVFLGFGPSFYLRAYFAPKLGLPPLPSTLVWVHGLVFTTWMLVLLAQSTLVRVGQVRVHRRLGAAGAVLAALMVLLATAAQVAQTQRVVAAGLRPFDVVPENFTTIATFLAILNFGALTGAAVLLRKRPESHKRLMILATVQLLGAATGRIGGILGALVPPLGPFALLVGIALSDVFIVALLIQDLRGSGRLHRATIWGSVAILLLQAITFTPFYASAAATAFTVWLGRLTL
jgi:hypothetical protein